MAIASNIWRVIFLSNSDDHGVISMTVRQAAYLYGVVKARTNPRVLEIGRYKGGSTLVIAAAMGEGSIVSIDDWTKELRLYGTYGVLDSELKATLGEKLARVTLLKMDSRQWTPEGEFDVAVIDGDHSYDGVLADVSTAYKVLVPGGDLLMDDAAEGHPDTVGRAIKDSSGWTYVRTVDRMMHMRKG